MNLYPWVPLATKIVSGFKGTSARWVPRSPMCHTVSLENFVTRRHWKIWGAIESSVPRRCCFIVSPRRKKERLVCYMVVVLSHVFQWLCVWICLVLTLHYTMHCHRIAWIPSSPAPFPNKMRNLFPMFGESCANGPKSQERWQKICVKKTWDVAAKLLAQSLVVVAITQIVRCCDPWICSGTSPRSTQLVWNKTTEKLKTWLFFWLFYYITILIIPRIILYTNTIRVGHSEFPCDDMDKSVTKTLFFNISHVRKVC